MKIKISSPADLGAVLRETRTSLKLPALDLAAIVGLSPTTLRRLEAGNATAAIGALFHLFDELGIEVALSPPPGAGPIELPAAGKSARRRRVSR